MIAMLSLIRMFGPRGNPQARNLFGVVAARMDVQPRTVQRSLARLDELGLVKRVIEELPDGEEQQVCDPSGLRQRLIELAKVGKQGDISDVF